VGGATGRVVENMRPQRSMSA